MARWILAACAALALASAGALAQSIGTPPPAGQPGAAPSGEKEGAPPQRSAPSRPSKPMAASTPGSSLEAEGASTTLPDPSRRPPDPVTTQVGGSGSSGLAAMGGGIDVTASPTNQMGAGNLMPDCPMGMVRHLGLCVTYDQARRAQMPKPQR